jgi:hypothetical protein
MFKLSYHIHINEIFSYQIKIMKIIGINQYNLHKIYFCGFQNLAAIVKYNVPQN